MKTIVGITNHLTDNELSQLDSFVSLYNKISHKLYVDLFIKKLPIKEICPAYQDKFLINKRQFDSIRKVLEGKVSSILALNKNYIQDTEEKIKSLEKTLKTQHKNYLSYQHKHNKKLNEDKDKDNKNKANNKVKELSKIEINLKNNLQTKIKYNNIRLDRAKAKLKRLEYIRDSGDVRLCFGSNKLFKQQFQINSKNNLTQFKSHEDWYKEFHYQRHKEFTLVGSKDESAGNLNAQIKHIKDNLFTLQLNINPHAVKLKDRYIHIQFKVDYEVETLKQIIKNNESKNKDLWQPLTYKLIKQPAKSHNKNKYVVAISFEKHLIKRISTSKDKGSLGVDLNQDHLAVVDLDNKGNLLSINTYEYNLNGNKNQNNNSISLAVKQLMQLATKLNKPIFIEQLDFSNKKKSLSLVKNNSNFSKNRNKQLSSFAYSKIIELIKVRAGDNFIEVREVNPAYTSLIGSIKYAKRSRISIHHSAAMCIGRRGLFNSYKQIVVMNKDTKIKSKKPIFVQYKEKRISSKNKHIKATDLPVRNNLKTHIYWKELKEIMLKNQKHKKKCSTIATKYSTSKRYEVMPAENISVGTLS